MMKLGVHYYITRLIDYFETSEYFYMVLEHEGGGNLLNYLSERNNYISESKCRVIAQKLAQGI